LWGRLADLAQSYLKKGSQVYVEGRLQTRDWEDQQGQKHYKTEVVVSNMQFLDSKNVDGGIPQEGGSSNYSATTTSTQDSASTQDPGNAQETPPDEGFIKDDIPF